MTTALVWRKRSEYLDRFYDLLWEAEQTFGLWTFESALEADRRGAFPDAGVYFFFEDGELRAGHSDWHRVVRVGTHQVSEGSKSRLIDRLKQHSGAIASGIGENSAFRDLVCTALSKGCEWGSLKQSDPQKYAKLHEKASAVIRHMSFVVIPVDDAASASSDRRKIEMGAISLLSNYRYREDFWIDPPSEHWLGYSSVAIRFEDAVSASGLWNVDGVEREPDPAFLDVMVNRIQKTERLALPVT